MDHFEMRNEVIKVVNRFLYDHELEDAAAVLCNLALDLVEQTDEDFAMDFISVVSCNERFDLD